MKYAIKYILPILIIVNTFSFNYNLGFNKGLLKKLDTKRGIRLEEIILNAPFIKNGEAYLEVSKKYDYDQEYLKEIEREERFAKICTLNGKKELIAYQYANQNNNGAKVSFRF